MSITFKPTAKLNPQDRNLAAKFYATAVSKGKTDIDGLSKLVAGSSTVSRADTYAVIIALLEVIINEFSQGRSIDMGKLGRFSVSLQSEGVAKPEDLSSSNIAGAHINFAPGRELKEMLTTLKYVKEQ